MKKAIFILSFFLLTIWAQGQQYINSSLNLDMERVSPDKDLPDGWFMWGKGFHLQKDNNTVYQGKYSVSVSSPDDPGNDFGCITYSIPAKYTGKEIELRAYVKMEDVAGRMGLLMRIDGKSGTLAFDNMQSKQIKGTADWTQYSVKLAYPEGAKSIYVGTILSGKGKIWADNFEVFIDGKDIKYIEPTETTKYKADKDTEFDKGSAINKIDLTPGTISYLQKLGLIWGFTKYYHPTIAKGDYNWDYELFRYLPKILAISNNKERDKIVYEWLQSLGEFEMSTNTVPIENVKLAPDLNWIENSGFDKELVSILHKIKNSERGGGHFYIGAAPYVWNPVFLNESAYKDMKYPDVGFRLLSLYRYWNMIQYFFPYRHLIEEDWKNILTEFIPRFVNASDELEYKLATLEIIARIKDTHANIWSYEPTINKFRGVNATPYKVRFIEEKAIITNYLDEEKAKRSGLQIGDIITHINGKELNDYGLKIHRLGYE
ncbi:MAG: hypothetical protein ACK5M3_14300 [Dysgonomonas sp.]